MDPELILAVRDLVPDDAQVFGDAENEYLFTDAQISRVYNGVGKSSIVRTAGFLCISVGNSEALIGKVIKTTDLTTDASKLQATWSAQGQYYIGLADAEGTSADATFFQIIDYKQGWYPEAPELTEWGWENR